MKHASLRFYHSIKLKSADMFFPHFQVVHIFSTPPPPPPIFLMKQPSSWLTLSGRIYRVLNHKSYEGGYLASIGLQNQWGKFL